MNVRVMSPAGLLLVAGLACSAAAVAQTPGPFPTPLPGVASIAAPPPPDAVPRVRPSGPLAPPLGSPPPGSVLIRFSGQLLDYRAGFAYFTTGDGFRVAPDARIVDAKTGAATSEKPHVKSYARASFDGSGNIVELALSGTRLAPEAAYEKVKRYAVAISTPAPNPDLQRGARDAAGRAPTGRGVAVTFVVRVPLTTPFGDSVYLTTDATGWNPQAIRLDRIDALHYRVTRTFASGTLFRYRYTRGTWPTEERGQNGLEDDPRIFNVREADALRKDDIVYHWADEGGTTQEAGPNAIPTPFNPRPFPFATGVPGNLNGPAPSGPTRPGT